MKIVHIEDDPDSRIVFKEYLQEGLPDFDERGDYLEGGLFDESERLLRSFQPTLDEKTIIILDGTLNYRKDRDTLDQGNGFELVAKWLRQKGEEYEGSQDRVRLQNLRENVTVILYPSSFDSYQRSHAATCLNDIITVCKEMGMNLLKRERWSGDTSELVNEIRSLVLPQEGRGAGWKK